MIVYGVNLLYSYYFLLGVVVTLFVVYVVTWIVYLIMKYKVKKLNGGKRHD